MKHLPRQFVLTAEVEARIRDVEAALVDYVPGRDSCDVVDLPKLRLVDAVLDALERLPQKAKAAKVSLVTKKRRRA